MEITYTMQGDYLLPNLTLPEQDNRPIGLWGNNTFAISNKAVRYSTPTCSQNVSLMNILPILTNRRRRCMTSLCSLLLKKKAAPSNSKPPIKCCGCVR